VRASYSLQNGTLAVDGTSPESYNSATWMTDDVRSPLKRFL